MLPNKARALPAHTSHLSIRGETWQRPLHLREAGRRDDREVATWEEKLQEAANWGLQYRAKTIRESGGENVVIFAGVK